MQLYKYGGAEKALVLLDLHGVSKIRIFYAINAVQCFLKRGWLTFVPDFSHRIDLLVGNYFQKFTRYKEGDTLF